MWERSQAINSLTTGLAKSELKHRVMSRFAQAEAVGLSQLRTRLTQAQLLVENLGRLKGAFMKAGQLLSIDASDLFPPEAIRILSQLQAQADPIDFVVIRGVLESELGEAALAHFTHFLFLHRKLGGIFHQLKRLDVRMNLSPYWDRMIAC